ncbi:MAG: AMP-binding protein, partial [Bacteroidales bacterium]|nr:AMP-binding protein [Bacteroidales bacterium]
LNSVGQNIKGLESHIIDLETAKILETGKDGMIVVRGRSIFNGYLDKKVEKPEVEINGKTFYKTGDIGHYDEDGYLFITGRLKRFIKIGGEMISMPFIEKILESKFGEEGRSVLAVEGCDKMHKPMVVLFSIIPLDIKEVNKHLRANGVSTLAKIRDVKIIEEIPLLGSGKTNYRLLKELLKEDETED